MNIITTLDHIWGKLSIHSSRRSFIDVWFIEMEEGWKRRVEEVEQLSVWFDGGGRSLWLVIVPFRSECLVIFDGLAISSRIVQEGTEWIYDYFDKFAPFLVLFQSLKGMFAHWHFVDKHTNSPYISMSATISSLCILRWQIFHGSIYRFIFILVIRSMLMRQSEITQFDSPLNLSFLLHWQS